MVMLQSSNIMCLTKDQRPHNHRPMSEEKTDTIPPRTRQSYHTFELILKIVQTLVLLGILISLALLTSQLRGFSTVLGDIVNQGSFPVTITGRMPDVGVSGVVSIGNQPNGAIAITNQGATSFDIRSTT
jgi:hypothetical protein